MEAEAGAEALVAESELEGADVVTTGFVVVVGAVVGAAVVPAAAVSGAVTRRLRHSPWLPDVSTAETWTDTLTVRCGHETVALVSVVWTVVKPSPLTTYSFTATLSWPVSHASEIVVSLLTSSRRPVRADGGRVSGVAELALDGGADQTGIFAVEGFEVAVAPTVREIPASAP